MPTLVCLTTDEGFEFQHAKVHLTAALAQQLLDYRKLYQLAKEQDDTLYCLEFFNYHASYGSSLTTLDDEPDLWDRWYAVADDTYLHEECAAGCCCVAVTDTGVLWSASPKHDSGYFETPEISWAELEKVAAGQQPFAIIPPSEEPDDNPANPGVGCI